MLAISILHIGLPLDHALIPPGDGPSIAKRLREIEERMTRAGYRYEVIHASPETGLDDFKLQLKTRDCDGVLIGGGVAGDPALRYFMEQIINAAHEMSPKVKIMFYSHSVDVETVVGQWFGPAQDTVISTQDDSA